MRPLKGTVRRLVKYAGTRLWEQLQWPDIDALYERAGIFGVMGFLQQSCDPKLTREVLERFGAHIDPECGPLGPNLTMHECPHGFQNLTVGAHVHIGRQVFLDLTDRLILENSVSIGMRAILLTHLNMGHGVPDKPLAKLFPRTQKPTILRRGCSVGAGAIVACGVEIGEDAVVNAGVLVDQDVPPRTVVTSSRQKADFRIPDRLFDVYLKTR